MGQKQRVHLVIWDTWFPNHKRDGLYKKSEADPGYNCIAWAAGDNLRWWQFEGDDYYWPDGIPKDQKPETLVRLFEKLGYERCRTGCRKRGYEKIALYVGADGLYSHAARQRMSGEWASKFGFKEDAHHATPKCLCGTNKESYGSLYCFMRRKKQRGSRSSRAAS